MDNQEERSSTKEKLHINNKHRKAYDFKKLIKANADLNDFARRNEYGDFSINFGNNNAVIELNKAILASDYNINGWEIPEGYLCPPIPGRAEYIHHLADILKEEIDAEKEIKVLDIGVGANCIYPLIGAVEYNWNFVGSDIDAKVIDNAQNILNNNPTLKSKIELRLQKDSSNIFNGIIKEDEVFDISICNPPFFTSEKDYIQTNVEKVRNLTGDENAVSESNFGGKSAELWCLGGEKRFIKSMIKESKNYGKSVKWFTTLVSNNDHLKQINKTIAKYKATQTKTIKMTVGHKISRFVAWSFQ